MIPDLINTVGAVILNEVKDLSQDDWARCFGKRAQSSVGEVPRSARDDRMEALAALFSAGMLQRSSEIFGGVIAKFFLQHRYTGEFSGVETRQNRLEGLMPGQRIQQRQKARLVGCGEK